MERWPRSIGPVGQRSRSLLGRVLPVAEYLGMRLRVQDDPSGHKGTKDDEAEPQEGVEHAGTAATEQADDEPGLAVFHEPIRRGVAWLEGNQRESGRWFTRSLSNDKAHYI